MKALFICDEKEEWNLLRNIFHAHFSKMELVCVLKGEDALNTLTFDGPFGMIIIECGIKSDNPTELAESIFDQTGPRPLLFVGTPTMVKDRVKEEFFNEYEMVTIYNKPYQADELVTSIQDAIDWVKKEEFESSIVELEPDNFLPLKLRNFYLYDSVPFDVYVELTKTKFIKAIAANKKYTQSNIQDFQKRNIKFLYLEKNEHLNFLENSIKKISMALAQSNSDIKKKSQTMVAGVLVLHQYLRDVGISESVKDLTDRIIKSMSDVAESYTSIEDLILNFPMEHGDLAEQAVLKGTLGIYITKAMGWRSDLTNNKIGLAAILHDAFLEREEWSTITYEDHPDLDYLSPEQKEAFLFHPKRAAEMANQFSHLAEVDFIILEHHELPDGNGFPRGINASKITKISALFILVNNYIIQLVINGLTPSALRNISLGFSTIYNIGSFKEPFQTLQKDLKKK